MAKTWSAIKRSDGTALGRLKQFGLRPTRQRLALASLLFGDSHRHVTAEALHAQAVDDGVRVSLATVYNTLHQFVKVGLLDEVVVDPGKSYFDTNTGEHHHFYHEDTGRLEDIPSDSVVLGPLPDAPPGTQIGRVDVVIRVTGGR